MVLAPWSLYSQAENRHESNKLYIVVNIVKLINGMLR